MTEPVAENPHLQPERDRMLEEYARRARELPQDMYAPWQESEMFMRMQRRTAAARLLHRAGCFPARETRCLEIGFGDLGWLGVLVDWGVDEKNIHGLELDGTRVRVARERLPVADLRVGDATQLPWKDGEFDLIIASTVFSSVLDPQMRRGIAREITRVLSSRGAFLWYDFAWNNPSNKNVRGVTDREIRELFPTLRGSIRRVTLAPPLVRAVTPRSWIAAELLSAIPWLRTHRIAALTKK